MADPLLSAGSLENDISAQLLTRIFGTGWDSLASLASGAPADGVMGTLIFDLMYVLNSCCAVAVAWLFILTVLSAALGSAQDGTGIGGRRYSSACCPCAIPLPWAPSHLSSTVSRPCRSWFFPPSG